LFQVTGSGFFPGVFLDTFLGGVPGCLWSLVPFLMLAVNSVHTSWYN